MEWWHWTLAIFGVYTVGAIFNTLLICWLKAKSYAVLREDWIMKWGDFEVTSVFFWPIMLWYFIGMAMFDPRIKDSTGVSWRKFERDGMEGYWREKA